MKVEKISKRERIEWVNYWWEDANDMSKKRWCILGDSVMRQILGTLNSMLGNQIAVDYFGSSSYIDDPLFLKEIRDFFSVQDYSYDVILINVGFHHGLNRSVKNCVEDRKNFRKFYDDIIELCMTLCNNVIIISGTHHVETGDLEKLDEEVNAEIVARNEIALGICEDRGYIYVDLFNYFIKRHFQYKHRDIVHFHRNVDFSMAKLIYDAVINNGNLLKEDIEIKTLNLIDFEDIIKKYPVYLYGAGKIGTILMQYIGLRNGGENATFIVSDGQEKKTYNVGKASFFGF